MNDARIRIEIRPPLGYRDGWRIYTYRIADVDYPRRPRFTLGDAADGGPEMTADYGRIERDADPRSGLVVVARMRGWRLAGHIVLTVLTVGGWPILVLLVRLAQGRRR